MKKILVFLVLMAVAMSAFTDDALVLPKGVFRIYVTGAYGFASSTYDTDGEKQDIIDISGVFDRLPQLYEQLWDVFKAVENKQDTEAMERFLELEDVRQRFYEALSEFASNLKAALSSERSFAFPLRTAMA